MRRPPGRESGYAATAAAWRHDRHSLRGGWDLGSLTCPQADFCSSSAESRRKAVTAVAVASGASSWGQCPVAGKTTSSDSGRYLRQSFAPDGGKRGSSAPTPVALAEDR